MRDWENATWAAGIDEEGVMRKAGMAVAEMAVSMTKDGDEILVLVGKGKNGGDAVYAAEYIPDRKIVLQNATDNATIEDATKAVKGFNGQLIIDGLFGIGLSRPLSGLWVDLINALNEKKIPIVAVDTPSGLDGETGTALGGVSVKATVTVTFGAVKRGMLKPEAREYVGRIYVAEEIGLVPFPFDK